MKNFEKPTIEFFSLGEDIITTSTENSIKDGGENNETDWESLLFGIFNL